MAAKGSDWLTHFGHLLCNCCTEFHKTVQETSTQGPLQSLCFSCRSVNKYGRQGLWSADTFWTSPLQLLHRISQNFTGSKYSRSSTKIVFFMPNGQQIWPQRALIGWLILDISSAQNFTKPYSKQVLNVLYHFFMSISQQIWLSSSDL